jgi:hypothetical protein
MAGLSREDLDKFLSKVDFDFRTVAGWREFLAERRDGGSGRDADGFHLRDIKNYAVGVATVITRSAPVDATFTIRALGTGLALAPGNIFIFHPDQNWDMKVTTRYVGPPGSGMNFTIPVGGSTSDGRENWGSSYYIVLKSGELPGQGLAETANRRLLDQALKTSWWVTRRGVNLLTRGGDGYNVTVRVGSMGAFTNQFMAQEILSPEGHR